MKIFKVKNKNKSGTLIIDLKLDFKKKAHLICEINVICAKCIYFYILENCPQIIV